jgi:prepilin-type N-terminal cleavage/methylation domain-containing protein
MMPTLPMRPTVPMRRHRRGFTIAELLISMTVALVVITAGANFAVRSLQTRRGWTVRESVDRNARFVGMSLARDAQEAGVAMESNPVFATLGTLQDTLTVLSVPFAPAEAPVYSIYNDGGVDPNYPAGGNCGALCIELLKTNGTYTLAAGDLVRLQVGGTRRLLYLTGVANLDATRFRITFLDVNLFLGRDSGLANLLLTRSGTSVQKLKAVVYWRDVPTKNIMRAESFTASGQPIAQVMASNAEAWETSLLFVNNIEADQYNGLDADTTNDGNRVIGVKIRARLKTDRIDPAVNNGQAVYRWYEWRIAPRNLLYEKNRMN